MSVTATVRADCSSITNTLPRWIGSAGGLMKRYWFTNVTVPMFVFDPAFTGTIITVVSL